MVGSVTTNTPYIPPSAPGPGGPTGTGTGGDAVSAGVLAASQGLSPDQAALFQTLTQDAAALTPGGTEQELTPDQIAGLVAAVELISAMSVSGDTMSTLAAVIIKQQSQQRHEAVQDRVQMKQLAMNELMAAAGQLTKQADTLESGALTQLIVGVVGAALSIAGSVGSMGVLGKGVNETAAAESMANRFLGSEEKMLKTAGSLEALGGGVGKAFEAGGTYAGTTAQAESKREEAIQKIDEGLSQYLEGQADIKKSLQDNLEDMAKQLVALVKELQDAKSERMRAFTKV